MEHIEYPKWLRRDGKPDVLVDNADAEAEQLAAWGSAARVVEAPPQQSNALLPQLDHDKNGEPGGSKAPEGDVAELRKVYQAKFGKRPFPGWNAAELTARIETA